MQKYFSKIVFTLLALFIAVVIFFSSFQSKEKELNEAIDTEEQLGEALFLIISFR